VLGVVAAPRGAALADLQQEPAVDREFQYLGVVGAVTGEPDVVVRVDEDAVLALGPFVAGARAAPGTDDVARLIKDDDGWRRDAALAVRRVLLGAELALAQRAGALHDPDVIARVDRDARDLP